MHITEDATEPVLRFGISGIDDVLRGGLPDRCVYLVTGSPGAGKTTLATQFLLEGVRAGERALYITLSESKREIEMVAKSHGWDISSIEVCELAPSELYLNANTQLTVFNPSEIELNETTEAIIAAVNEYKPARVIIDSLSELRLAAQSTLRFRRQILALKRFLSGKECTVLLLDDGTGEGSKEQLESIAHGVLVLEQTVNQYGAERRRLRVMKLRGVPFRGGFHDFTIRRGGLDVFPRLVASEHHAPFEESDLPSGNPELDLLLGGGIPLGTSTLLIGPAGTGKSTIATQFAVSAAERGLHAALFIFDENTGTFHTRSRKLGIGVQEHIDSGKITLQQIDPAEMSSGEMAATVRRAVDGTTGAPVRVVVIDSLNGYLNAMPEERYLTAQLHELLAYLGQLGVVTFMTVTQSGMIGANMASPVDTTYLADNVILFRFFEALGQVRRAISVVKKRSGPHELTIRELTVSARGVEIGAPLNEFQGILTGTPRFVGNANTLTARPNRERDAE